LKQLSLYLFLAMLTCGVAWSRDTESTLQQLNHRTFTAAEGAPGLIYALAQTTDGTLWLGTGTGLVRFDGVRFVAYPGPGDDPLPSLNIAALAASPDGALWIGFRFGGIAMLRDGRVTLIGERDGLPRGSFFGLAWDPDGSLWAAASGGLARVRGGHAERVAGDLFPSASAVFVDRAGNVWAATASHVYARATHSDRFQEMATLTHESDAFVNHQLTIAQSNDERVWAAGQGILLLMDPPTAPTPRNLTFKVPEIEPWLLLADSEGSVWMRAHEEINRWPLRQQTRDMRERDLTAHPEVFGRADGLVGRPMVFLEDREHNVWVATDRGLEQFTHSNVIRAVPVCHGWGYAIAAGDAGTLWAVCPASMQNEGGTILKVRDGQVVWRQESPAFTFTAAYRDSSGVVWFGGPTGLGHMEGDTVVRSPAIDAVRGFQVQALAREEQGALWVSVVRKGVFRVVDGQWTEYGGLDALPRGPAVVETTDGEGAVWFGYPENKVARVRDRTVQIFGAADGVNVGNVTAIYDDGQHIWIGGEFGVARFGGARFVPLEKASGRRFEGVSGITGSRDGSLWLNAAAGITHIVRAELDRAVRDPHYRVEGDTLDYLDGVPGTAAQLRPLPSAISATDGRVWFVTTEGLIWIDPTPRVRNTLAPPVTVWSLTSEGRQYANRAMPLDLPIHTTRVQIDYSAGSLTIPERVRFRYRLEGSETAWQEAGSRREAVYTNLRPGRYKFQVLAANNDGVWNNEGGSLEFTIAPAFYQTKWFYALCAILGLALVVALHRLRTRQIVAQIRARLEERLSERERIARELHDTLFQGVQGLILRFQVATDRIPRDVKAREMLQQSIERADQLLAQSRDRVRDLRDKRQSVVGLPELLAAEGEQLARTGHGEFRLVVEGTPRELHPIIREEAFFVVREALRNAFTHSGAEHIEAEVSFENTALRVRVRDDGQGIEPNLLDGAGAGNHFGLLGMRERARKIRGHLLVWSRSGAGTEIELRVPADLAYQTERPPRRSSWWRRAAGAITQTHPLL
jgi:signal transduction histidine kinase/ligand-binding sensor domain-containing protein